MFSLNRGPINLSEGGWATQEILGHSFGGTNISLALINVGYIVFLKKIVLLDTFVDMFQMYVLSNSFHA